MIPFQNWFVLLQFTNTQDWLIIYSLSTILSCRFHLTLQERRQDPNSNSKLPSFVITSLNPLTQRMYNSLSEEFGDQPASAGTLGGEMEDQET
jgi:hypothetical protein